MKRILIVDDASFMRKILRNLLEEHNYEVIAEASNGEEALRQYEIHRPDLVMMDITMPVMDGLEATERILELDSSAKIIVCSAMGQKQMILKVITAGAKDFIVKPFQADRVIVAIDNVFNYSYI